MSQLVLYPEQRDVGWVGTDWREMGVPVWLSFAFWQWFAVLFLEIGLGHLAAAEEPSETAAGEPSNAGSKAERED